jgi:hypothetical protein
MAKKEIINADPFAAVDLVELLTADGDQSGTFAVRMLEPEEGNMIPLKGQGARHGSGYRLVTNERIYQIAVDILTRSGHEFQPVPTYGLSKSDAITWDGTRFSAKWYVENVGEDIMVGDIKSRLMLGCEAKNSYDGSTKLAIEFFMMFQACANQFYSSNLLGGFTFRHHDRIDHTLDQDIEDAVQLITAQAQVFTNAMPKIRHLMSTPLGRPRKVVPQVDLESVDWSVFEPEYSAIDNFQSEVGRVKRLVDNPTTVYNNSLKGFLNVRNKMKDIWKPSWDSHLLDELNHSGVTSRMELPQAANMETLWGVLNAYTAVSTHVIGGFQGAGISRRVTDRFVGMN